MKRKDLIKHLRRNGAFLLREGTASIKKTCSKHKVPRHREIVDELARKICKDLNLPFVR